ncbi:MAG: 2-C-methyl-D-erythritol 4-phosphate cytidylyltransferase [Gammaproteobacteria bacterium]|nr:2-C-methyl-D-erythritol 4-phosphate cytidylyltransferase [Gammaproteobacteria bacterium]
MGRIPASYAQPRYWAIVPAAGYGKRMESDIPKQYLDLLGQPVVAHSLQRLAQVPHLAGIVVALSAQDTYWPSLAGLELSVPVHTVTGGEQRCHSVQNALRFLQVHANVTDWVLVHDAARPCVRVADMILLIEAVLDYPAGGVLAMRVRDTMKRSEVNNRVLATVERNNLWHALTPQLFPVGILTEALETALQAGIEVTDEAMAVELFGKQPLLVEGASDNVKITRQADLALAAFYLQQQAAIKKYSS